MPFISNNIKKEYIAKKIGTGIKKRAPTQMGRDSLSQHEPL
jgi:hypothetical protein